MRSFSRSCLVTCWEMLIHNFQNYYEVSHKVEDQNQLLNEVFSRWFIPCHLQHGHLCLGPRVAKQQCTLATFRDLQRNQLWNSSSMFQQIFGPLLARFSPGEISNPWWCRCNWKKIEEELQTKEVVSGHLCCCLAAGLGVWTSCACWEARSPRSSTQFVLSRLRVSWALVLLNITEYQDLSKHIARDTSVAFLLQANSLRLVEFSPDFRGPTAGHHWKMLWQLMDGMLCQCRQHYTNFLTFSNTSRG